MESTWLCPSEEEAASDTCTKGKQVRLPIPTSETKSEKRLQLMHMDVTRPMVVAFYGRARCFATHLVDYRGDFIVKPIEHRIEVNDVTQAIVTELEK
jgi:hypothetical protein